VSDFDCELFVIGAGSGGVRAARVSASLGAKVIIAEERYLGGTCVNVGCVPKKLFAYAAHYHEDFSDAAGFGWACAQPRFDWQRLLTNKNTEIKRLNGVYRQLLENSGVQLLEARATLAGPHEVSCNGRVYRAKHILIATGGRPFVPNFSGHELVITSNEAFFLDNLPERAVVVGGGYIAVEFACIFNGLGVNTTLVYRGPLFLRGFDDDVRACLAREMAKKGVTLNFETHISEITPAPKGLNVQTDRHGKMRSDLVMYATGRVPNVAGLGLEKAGIKTTVNGAIVVDDYYCSSVASIYAIGDVIDKVQLTPVAIAEAMSLAHTLFGKERDVDYEFIPTAVFSQPNIGTVGYTEDEARKKYGSVAIYRTEFRPLKHTLTGSDEKTMMKMIVDKASDRVVGVHMVGPDAGETIQGMAIALRAGATKAIFDTTIGIHPTAAEEFVTMREPVS
jgi:glutathione reductase (NADPH)